MFVREEIRDITSAFWLFRGFEQLVTILLMTGSKVGLRSWLERVILPLDIPRLVSLSFIPPNLASYFSATPSNFGLTCELSQSWIQPPVVCDRELTWFSKASTILFIISGLLNEDPLSLSFNIFSTSRSMKMPPASWNNKYDRIQNRKNMVDKVIELPVCIRWGRLRSGAAGWLTYSGR